MQIWYVRLFCRSLFRFRHCLFRQRLCVHVEKECAAEVEYQRAQEEREQVARQFRYDVVRFDERDDEVDEADIVEHHRQVRVEEYQHRDGDYQRNRDRHEVRHAFSHERHADVADRRRKKQAHRAADERVPKALFIRQLFLHEEQGYRGEKRPVYDLN